MQQLFTKILAAIVLSSIMSCHTQKYKVWLGEQGEQKIHNLAYGEHKRQKMDIFLPAGYTGQPLVVIVHGGAWKLGKKEHMLQLQRLMYDNGIPSANINYRLVKKDSGTTYREQLDDLNLAVKKLDSLSAKGRWTQGKYILMGESSGGHISLLYGYSRPESVSKIISLSGPTDFYSAKYLNSFYSRLSGKTVSQMVGKPFDRTNLDPEYRRASPIYNIGNIETLHFQGAKDFLVAPFEGKELDSALTANGVKHRFVYMKAGGHAPRYLNIFLRKKVIFPEILNFIKKEN